MKKIKLTLEKHQTLREKIANSIREAIIKGSLKPGERIAEPDLAEKFGISRTPLREAFRQLESEGFLTTIPRRGAVVSSLTEKDVKEFYEIKSLLEGYAASLATEKLTEKDLKKMSSINFQLEKLAEDGDAKGFFKIHNDFHDVFWKAAGNEKLFELINNVMKQFRRFRIASLILPGRMSISVSQHKQIIEAFKNKDKDLAKQLVMENAKIGGEVLLKELLKSTLL